MEGLQITENTLKWAFNFFLLSLSYLFLFRYNACKNYKDLTLIIYIMYKKNVQEFTIIQIF